MRRDPVAGTAQAAADRLVEMMAEPFGIIVGAAESQCAVPPWRMAPCADARTRHGYDLAGFSLGASQNIYNICVEPSRSLACLKANTRSRSRDPLPGKVARFMKKLSLLARALQQRPKRHSLGKRPVSALPSRS